VGSKSVLSSLFDVVVVSREGGGEGVIV